MAVKRMWDRKRRRLLAAGVLVLAAALAGWSLAELPGIPKSESTSQNGKPAYV